MRDGRLGKNCRAIQTQMYAGSSTAAEIKVLT